MPSDDPFIIILALEKGLRHIIAVIGIVCAAWWGHARDRGRHALTTSKLAS
ncbi:MAG TPA: hypothetical protein VNO50_07815 [Pyrinomonadaceae bacterium]|nr:hypothetical protein [Pyrinomonadaceae bacterium]